MMQFATPKRLPRVLHLDAGRGWAGGQNQVRLLMRELARRDVAQLCLTPRGSALEARLSAEGLPVRGITWRGGSDPRAMVAIGRALEGFDVVHCHDAHALQVAILPARVMRAPIVAARRVHFATSGWKWNRADRVVAISETVERTLLASGVDAARIRRISSGVDRGELEGLPALEPSLRARLGVEAGEFLVGNIGHLLGYKGQEVIPPAAARTPGVRWAIVGEGERRPLLERLIAEHGVGGRVHLTGLIPDARRLLCELDLFVFSSTDEPLGTSVLDAMACGVPVVGAAAAGAEEILAPVHRETGSSLYPPGDAAALAALVERVRGDEALRRAMVEAQGVRLADFLVSRTADLTLEMYAEVARR